MSSKPDFAKNSRVNSHCKGSPAVVSSGFSKVSRIRFFFRLNRGIGIEVHKDMSEIMAFLSKKAAKLAANVTSQAPPGANTWVLQKYIENPVSGPYATTVCVCACVRVCVCVHDSLMLLCDEACS